MNFNFEVINSSYDVRDYGINADQNLPKEYVCPILPDIKNQGSKSTCVAHAVASLMEYHYEHQTKSKEKFSTDFIYGFRTLGYAAGEGMMIRDALNTILNHGDAFEKDWPGNNDFETASNNIFMQDYSDLNSLLDKAGLHRINSYYRCKKDNEIKTALMKHGPVVTSMNTYHGATLVNDVYTWDAAATYGRHCVLIVGWNEQGWLIQNSWGEGYGGDGRFIIPYNFKLNESWGIIDNGQDDSALKKPSKFIISISALYNKIANAIIKLVSKRS